MTDVSASSSEEGAAPSWKLAFAWAVPIAILGGLIGLGGAEFRLPVLVALFGLESRKAVPINMTVSLVTVIASLVFRTAVAGMPGDGYPFDAILALIAGGLLGAPAGVALISRLGDQALDRVLGLVLAAIGALLLSEGFLGLETATLVTTAWARILIGVVLGTGIGTVSSLLGVAGGELLIPTFVLVYGVGIKLAGTASLLVSFPTLIVGLLRHRARGWRPEPMAKGIIAAMGAGSIVGSLIGANLARFAPVDFLKVLLGVILIVSAVKTFSHQKQKK